MTLHKGQQITNGKRSYRVVGVKEDRDGYDIYWFQGRNGVRFLATEKEIVQGGYGVFETIHAR